MTTNNPKIIVTGSSGFLGRHLLPILAQRYGAGNVSGLTSKDDDLLQPGGIQRMFSEHTPDVLVHLAAYVGGIGSNRAYPADYLYRNIMLSIPVFKAAMQAGVKKLIYPIGGCSYPARAVSPIGEDQLWQGYPQKESAPYSLAKAMGLVASASFRQQYGFNSVVIIPGNMYGEYDNFSNDQSHVVPALIRRFHEATLNGLPQVAAWGTGKPERDFVYAGDVANVIPYFIDQYDSSQPVNISSGTRTSIRELTELVAELTGYPGQIAWDTTKPDGQMVKIFDISRFQALGLNCPTSLRRGLQKTIDWFTASYTARADGIRL